MPSATTIASVTLAVITFFYLLETRKQRLLTEKIVTETRNQRLLTEKMVIVETQPRVFIKTIDTTARAIVENNQIVINTKLILTNCGKVQAENIHLSYEILQGNVVRNKDTFGPYQYLFPGQTSEIGIPDLKFTITPEEMEIIKKAIKLDEPVRAAGNLKEPISLCVELVYKHPDGQEVAVPYEYRYILPMNSWVFPPKP